MGLLKLTFDSKELRHTAKTAEDKLRLVQRKIVEFFQMKSELIMKVGLENMFQEVDFLSSRSAKTFTVGSVKRAEELRRPLLLAEKNASTIETSLKAADFQGRSDAPLQGRS